MAVSFNPIIIQKMEGAYRKALLDTANLFVSLVKQAITNNQGSDTGELIKSIFVKNLGDRIQVGSGAPQAIIMEFGRKPLSKRPPMQALVPRLNRKGVVSGQTLEGLSSKEKGIVYVMAKSIGEKGIKPRKYFTNIFDEQKQALNDHFIQRFRLYFQ